MNEDHLTLIVDLVAGRLSPNDEKAALALVASDPALGSEYAAQMAVAARLAATPTPGMTSREREHLHAELKAQLHLDYPTVAPAAAPSRRIRWLAPLGGLAVAAAVVIGAVVVLPNTISNNEADTFEAAAEATTTVAATQEDDTLSEAGGLAQEAPPNAAPEESLTKADALSSGTVTALPFASDIDLAELAARYATNPELATQSLTKTTGTARETEDPQLRACLDAIAASVPDREVVALATTTYAGTDAVVVAVGPPGADGYLSMYDPSSCTELASTRP